MDAGDVIAGVILLLVAAAIFWFSQDSNRKGLADPYESDHTPIWVSGPGGGLEEIVCDTCGKELTEHPSWDSRTEEE